MLRVVAPQPVKKKERGEGCSILKKPKHLKTSWREALGRKGGTLFLRMAAVQFYREDMACSQRWQSLPHP